MANLLLLHGPNLNLLGQREKNVYGVATLAAINQRATELARLHHHTLVSEQYNGEGELISAIHSSQKSNIAFIIINAGAYTHTSIALRDALLAVDIPFIEVHLSNIYARESFRFQSYLADQATGVIMGFGAYSYELAVLAAIHHLEN